MFVAWYVDHSRGWSPLVGHLQDPQGDVVIIRLMEIDVSRPANGKRCVSRSLATADDRFPLPAKLKQLGFAC
jgi:hypothetical protein